MDAALVALLWQGLLARAWGVSLEPLASYALVPLGVWLAYAGDRMLDVRRMPQARTARHRFASKHAALLVCVWLAVATLAVLLGLWLLRSKQVFAAAVFLGFIAVYLLAGQRWPALVRSLLPRELVVGLVFAAGTAFFFAPGLSSGRAPGQASYAFTEWMLLTLAFACLCVFDCLVISWLERHEDRALGESTAASDESFSGARLFRLGCLLLLLTCALIAIPASISPAAAGRGSGLWLFGSATALCFLALLAQVTTASRARSSAGFAAWTDSLLLLPAALLLFL